jgi:hypothetical protein
MSDTETRRALIETGLGAGDVYRRALGFVAALEQAGGRAAFNEGAWYYGEAGAEVWRYGGPTREEAVEDARDAEVGCVAFGVKGLTGFSLDADDLIQNALEGCVEEEVGEGGEHGLDDVSKEALAELQVMLDAAVAAWVIRHRVTAFNFVECREERIDGGDEK